MEKASAGITGSSSLLFPIVFERFPENFSLGIFSLQPDYTGLILCQVITCCLVYVQMLLFFSFRCCVCIIVFSIDMFLKYIFFSF